ncbi:MAG: ATP-binding protein [candidate division Zixibacteria bacterium]|nr:ATP-binding protein [candidate division Zixibacteria bacterium]
MKTERSFAKTFDSLEDIHTFLEKSISASGLGIKQAYTLNLAAEEIFTNMVKYGSESSNDVKVRLSMSEKEVILCMIDSDVAEFDISSVKKIDSNRPVESIKPGGLGLHLVQNMADKFQYDYIDGSAIFTVTINIAK